MNIETIEINGNNYLEIDKIIVQNTTFVYLVNSKNNEDFCVRKVNEKEGKIFYDGLKDDDEFDLAMMYFFKKHKNILEKEDE